MGIFGNSGGSSLKPVPLPSEKKEKGSSGFGGLDSSKDAKGSVVKLSKKSFTIEKKIAEGGFAIVYLVSDKQNRYYALKRQLIRDDHRSLEACRRESQILKDMVGHKNIVTYLDHSLSPNKAGVHDYLLLTTYYKNNVLQMMNSRLAVNKSLSVHEVLAIFCDMCEAVAGLHHHRTGPIIHRDLKVENVLIDERTGSEKPVYVLCDFGSATTKILSTDQFSLSYIEEEIQKYTTLSYRAPEMIDLYSNIPIGVKSDIWALGVMLYKLCYFTLPFAESALAIQNGSFSFPSDSRIPQSIKALITALLTFDVNERPDIYQAASLAFDISKRRCPVLNQDNSRRLSVAEVYENYVKRFPKADTGKNDGTHAQLVVSKSGTFKTENGVEDEVDSSAVIVNTSAEKTNLINSNSTSVNPRLRPKPSASVPRVPAVLNPLAVDSAYCRKSPAPDFSGGTFPPNSEPLEPTPASAHYNSSFTAFDGSQPFSDDAGFPARSKSAGGTEQPLKTSAFKPYSISKFSGDSRSLNDTAKNPPAEFGPEPGNPFLDAPFGSSNPMVASGPAVMDDHAFGERFDEIRRIDRRYTIATAKYSTPTTATIDSIDDCTLRLIETDPFGCAPISSYQMHSSVRGSDESNVQESST
ncbi:hypothetical protein QR680_002644 [Steinernema hermaphroditum]|uniref:non-specific serine/threonine protein kinase n=1 Tax=Steinernema hermaphroditum TaxID=289476 RepID=A0AA39LIK1_9BILA|nr:hypothetical protein QR680_002644 [Steinernema hermaphroditum]